jgi:repressor LexA
MSILSERQRKILQFIITFFNENEFPPTIREIGEQVGITSTSVVNYNLAKLEELRLITRRKEVSRGLSINWDQVEKLNLTELLAPNNEHALLPMPEGNGHYAAERTPLVRIPILGRIAAGVPLGVFPDAPETTDDFVDLPEAMIKRGGRIFGLRVKGDSMIDASVLDGDIVVLRHQVTANDGDMVAAWLDGVEETTLKYLFREGRNIRLQPANPAFEPKVYPAEQVHVKGRVISIIRTFEN